MLWLLKIIRHPLFIQIVAAVICTAAKESRGDTRRRRPRQERG